MTSEYLDLANVRKLRLCSTKNVVGADLNTVLVHTLFFKKHPAYRQGRRNKYSAVILMADAIFLIEFCGTCYNNTSSATVSGRH